MRGVCVEERVTRMLTFWERRVTRDCGVMSFAYAEGFLLVQT